MSKIPVMPFYPDAHLADTQTLSAEEQGAYLLILLATWRNNGQPFPDDERLLATVTRLSRTRWRRVRARLEPFFDLSGGVWRQPRLERTWHQAAVKIEAKRRAGRIAQQKRWRAGYDG